MTGSTRGTPRARHAAKLRWHAAAAAAAFAACIHPAGQAAAQPTAPPQPGWSVHLASYGWFASTVGTVGAASVTGTVDDSFLDTLRQSDSLIGIMGRVELRRGRLGLFVDGQYTRLGYDDVRVGPATIDARSSLTTVEFGAAWQVAGADPAADLAPRTWALDVLGGGRAADWVDPFVGLRLRGRISERWEYALRGDVGGGIGGSRFSWQAAATIGYRFELFGLPATAHLGYRALSQDFESRRLTYDVTLHGPVVGLSLRF
jgi:hypothetical protein